MRLRFLIDVGLPYLTLDRLSSSLFGGESQRINLSTSLGSNLVGSMYILDEPSIGLHPRDTNLLIKVLKDLRDLGNSVLVVEHEEEIIRAADEIIDLGPKPEDLVERLSIRVASMYQLKINLLQQVILAAGLRSLFPRQGENGTAILKLKVQGRIILRILMSGFRFIQ